MAKSKPDKPTPESIANQITVEMERRGVQVAMGLGLRRDDAATIMVRTISMLAYKPILKRIKSQE